MWVTALLLSIEIIEIMEAHCYSPVFSEANAKWTYTSVFCWIEVKEKDCAEFLIIVSLTEWNDVKAKYLWSLLDSSTQVDSKNL